MARNASGEKVPETRQSAAANFFSRLIREQPLGTVGAAITLILLLTGIFADFLAPYGMNQTYVADHLSPPSAKFWFGTDDLGRDVFSRVIYGARVSVIVGLSGAVTSTLISLVIGVLSGYLGGKFDLLMQRGVDIWMSLPSLVLLMIIVTIVGPGMLPIVIILGLIYGIPGSRIIRGAVIAVKENAYVAAAKVTGCSTFRILARHILRNTMATAIVLFTVRVPAVILTEASLSFLGFGLPPPIPSWGSMISGAGREYMFQAPWMVLWPGVALAVVVYGINMFGDAVRDIVDPRLRGGSGRYGTNAKRETTAEAG
jgi:peptide/nickel transport system permease protein